MSEASHQISASEMFELAMRLDAIFTPYARRQREEFYTEKGEIKSSARFVHYTAAEAAH